MSRINYIGISTPLVNISDGLSPSVDAVYGPFNSISKAHTNLLETFGSNLKEGITVGIISGNTVKEYWYQGGTSQSNLVLKHPSSYDIYVENGGEKEEEVFYNTIMQIVDSASFVKLQSNAPVELKVTLQSNEPTTISVSNV